MSGNLAKLLIISGTPHYMRDGQLVGHGPTAREISHLAVRFERIHHIAYFHEGAAPAMMLPYSSERMRFIPVPFAGGDSLSAKASVLPLARTYISTILRELRHLDAEDDHGLVVHFDIIGDGPQRADFEARAALSLPSCVAFHGWQPRTSGRSSCRRI
jgi:hypothetical protein